MKKRTRFAALLLSLSFVASLAACGGNPPGDSDQDDGSQQTQTDTVAPVLTLGTVPTTMTAGESITLEFSATDNVSDASDISYTVKVFKDTTMNVTRSVYNESEKTFTPTSAGKYKIVVEATDEAGNSAKEEREITVAAYVAKDTVAPLITVNLAKRVVLGQSLDLIYGVQDDVSARENITSELVIKTQSGEDVTATVYNAQTHKFTPTALGTYTVKITAYDEANNKAEETRTVVVYEEGTTPPDILEDETPPVIQLGQMPSTLKVNAPYTVQFTVSDNVSETDDIKVLVAIKDETDGLVGGIYHPQTRAFTPVVAGVYKIVITARDENDNLATATHTVTVTKDPLSAVAYPSRVTYNNVGVHDPSIYYNDADGRYYAFGSHFAVASSADLITWRQDAADGTGYSTLYGTNNWRSVLSQTAAEVGGSENTWAPDVEKIGNTYYMYYSLTSGFGGNHSVIGRVSSQNILGPYGNEELILVSNGSGKPNCIDPELFYDKDGKLWMVYGSFFAGIYVKELYTQAENPQKAGLPKEAGLDNYGTLIWKGSGTGVEGPFVFYAPETDYYYLMVSDGNLRASNGDGTYNMRVARSQNPNGPYVDIKGTNVATAAGGNKLAGNYQFEGDPNGYGALGHNSVIRKDGKYFNVYHARKRENTDKVTAGHNLQVNQLFFNEDGWPVMAPNRYANENLGIVTQEGAAGDYDVVVHTTGTVKDFVDSTHYTFAANGTILNSASSQVGTWSVSEDYYVTLTLNSIQYKGVIAPAWCTYQDKAILSITAVSNQGGSIWANASASQSQSLPQLPSGVSYIQKIDGSVKARQISAFNQPTGFAVSLTVNVGTADVDPDWKAVLINSWGMAVTLPNLDPWNNVTSTRTVNFPTNCNLYPTSNGTNYNYNSHAHDTYLNTTSYVTVSVSTANGVSYYKNGELTHRYPLNALIGSKKVEDFVNVLIDCVRTDGFMLADGSTINGASNLVLTTAVTTDAQALEIYNTFHS